MKDSEPKKYLAFISYRHADNKSEGRQWATWLHQAIETYEVPADLVGRPLPEGGEIPSRIYPIFRDEDELPADSDLGGAITRALDSSSMLVVLCSPRAVESTYVADEIDYFKKIGRSSRIIAAIIDGEPNVSWDKGKQAAGFDPIQECFPIPLQFEYESGIRTARRAEPIAADFRVNNDGLPEQGWTTPEAYKQALQQSGAKPEELTAKLQSYEKQLHLMLLKIIAGILGVPLSDLTKRDKEYQLALERDRAKKLRRWLVVVASLAIVAVVAGVFAVFKQQEANTARLEAERRLIEQMIARADTLTIEADRLLDEGQTLQAVEKLFEAMPEDVENPEWPISDRTKVALNRAMSNFTELAAFNGPQDEVVEIRPVGQDRVLLFSAKGNVYLYSATGALLGTLSGKSGERGQYYIGPDDSELVAVEIDSRVLEQDDIYAPPSYFVMSYKMNLATGEVQEIANMKVEGYRPSLIVEEAMNSRINQVFFGDGEKILVDVSNYENNKLALLDINSAVVETPLDMPAGYYEFTSAHSDQYGIVHLLGSESKLLVADFVKGEVRTMQAWRGRLRCKNGGLLGVDEATSSTPIRFSVNEAENRLMAVVPVAGEHSYSKWCLTGWDLGSDEQLPVAIFDDYVKSQLTENEAHLLESVYMAHPTTVVKKINGAPERASKAGVYAHRYIPGRPTLSAWAVASTINLTHAYDEVVNNSGGALTSLYLSPDGDSLWFSDLDGTVSHRALGAGELYTTGLKNISHLALGESYILVADDQSPADALPYIEYSLSGRQEPNFGVVDKIMAGYDKSRFDVEEFGTGWPAIVENADEFRSYVDDIEQHRVWRIDPQSRKVPTKYNIRLSGPYLPPRVGVDFGARIEDGKIVVTTFHSGDEAVLPIPVDVKPIEIAILKNRIFVSARSENQENAFDEVVIYTAELSSDSALEPVPIKKAHSVVFRLQSETKLLVTGVAADTTDKKVMGVLHADGTYRALTIKWDVDELGIGYLLSDVSDSVYIVRDWRDIQVFNYEGKLLDRAFIDASFVGSSPELRYGDRYLYTDDKYVSFVPERDCPELKKNEFGFTSWVADKGGRYLLDSSNGEMYDMNTCTVVANIPAELVSSNSESIISSDGDIWASNLGLLYRLPLVDTFWNNYKKANIALESRRKN